MKSARQPAATRRGFTLIELLVVIGIIVLLIAILLPVVASVRKQAYNTSTQSQMSRIMSACLAYYHDFNSYPGPLANSQVVGGTNSGLVTFTDNAGGATITKVTSSENLVLGLLGFLKPGAPITYTSATVVAPDTATANKLAPPTDVANLNPLHPAAYHYLDYVPDELSQGRSRDLDYIGGVGGITPQPTDSRVPEFVDRFPDKMPIVYMRANVGNPDGATTKDTLQYNIAELQPYSSLVRTEAGAGKLMSFNTATFVQMITLKGGATPAVTLADDEAVPYDDFYGVNSATKTYMLVNPNIAGSTKGKDTFVLISAGKDRTYGTQDDILVTP